MSMSCTTCGKRSYSEYCVNHKPRKPIQTKTIKKIQNGKIAMQWEKFRRKWLHDNPGAMPCHYCGRFLSNKRVTLDHKIPRSRAPHLRFELSNIVPACLNCNYLKGSVDHDSYKHECHS